MAEPAAENLYRDHALAQQAVTRASTDRLQLVQPGVSLAAWLTLALSVAAVIAASLVRVPVTVEGRGIVLEETGVGIISADTDGRVVDLRVSEGARVRAGDVIAEVAQADTVTQLGDARLALREAQSALARGREGMAQTRAAFQLRNEQRRDMAKRQMAIETDNLQRLLKRQAGQEKLAQQGFVSPMSLIDGEQDILAARRRIEELREPLEDADVDRKSRAADDGQRMLDLSQRVEDAQRRVADLEEQLTRTARVVSPRDGVVSALRVAKGDVVSRQTEVATVIPTDAGHRQRTLAYFFVPSETGTQVRPGMSVNLVPTSISPEEYGYMRGTVIKVSSLPAGSDDLERLLRNRDLVQLFMQSGVPVQMEVELERGATPSGYQWTSSRGPEMPVGRGTQISGRVKVREERLIVVGLPFLKRFFA